jgi:hypothetical protein
MARNYGLERGLHGFEGGKGNRRFSNGFENKFEEI